MISGLLRRVQRARRTAGPTDEDEGSALILTIVFVLVVSLMVMPMMDYVMGVTRSNRVLVHHAVEIMPSSSGDDGSGFTYGAGIDAFEPAWMLVSAHRRFDGTSCSASCVVVHFDEMPRPGGTARATDTVRPEATHAA